MNNINIYENNLKNFDYQYPVINLFNKNGLGFNIINYKSYINNISIELYFKVNTFNFYHENLFDFNYDILNKGPRLELSNEGILSIDICNNNDPSSITGYNIENNIKLNTFYYLKILFLNNYIHYEINDKSGKFEILNYYNLDINNISIGGGYDYSRIFNNGQIFLVNIYNNLFYNISSIKTLNSSIKKYGVDEKSKPVINLYKEDGLDFNIIITNFFIKNISIDICFIINSFDFDYQNLFDLNYNILNKGPRLEISNNGELAINICNNNDPQSITGYTIESKIELNKKYYLNISFNKNIIIFKLNEKSGMINIINYFNLNINNICIAGGFNDSRKFNNGKIYSFYIYDIKKKLNNIIYKKNNDDINQYSDEQLLNHYIYYGISENRIKYSYDLYNYYNDFNIDIYSTFNKNLLSDFKTNDDIIVYFHKSDKKNIIYSLKTFYKIYYNFNFNYIKERYNLFNYNETATILYSYNNNLLDEKNIFFKKIFDLKIDFNLIKNSSDNDNENYSLINLFNKNGLEFSIININSFIKNILIELYFKIDSFNFNYQCLFDLNYYTLNKGPRLELSSNGELIINVCNNNDPASLSGYVIENKIELNKYYSLKLLFNDDLIIFNLNNKIGQINILNYYNLNIKNLCICGGYNDSRKLNNGKLYLFNIYENKDYDFKIYKKIDLPINYNNINHYLKEINFHLINLFNKNGLEFNIININSCIKDITIDLYFKIESFDFDYQDLFDLNYNILNKGPRLEISNNGQLVINICNNNNPSTITGYVIENKIEINKYYSLKLLFRDNVIMFKLNNIVGKINIIYYYNLNIKNICIGGGFTTDRNFNKGKIYSFNIYDSVNFNLNFELYKTQNINLKNYSDKDLVNNYFFNYTSKNIFDYEPNFYNIFFDFNIDIYITFNKELLCYNIDEEIIHQYNSIQEIIIYFFNSNKDNIIYSLKTFYNKYQYFNYQYIKEKYYLIEYTEVETIIYSFKNKLLDNYILSDVNYNRKRDILIFPHHFFTFEDGGVVALYNIAKNLDKLGVRTRIAKEYNNIHNSIYNNFYNNDFDINDTILIYPEMIRGNPLNVKYIVRWILAELGTFDNHDYYHSWDKNDLVYYFNNESKIEQNSYKINIIYKFLSLLFINPEIKNYNGDRSGFCFTMRKYRIHNHINFIHPCDSFEITRTHTQEEYIRIFNQKKYFISYDPLTFLNHISTLCGCVAIIYPLNNLSKSDWLKTTALKKYMTDNNVTEIYGIAYGNSQEELDFANNTIHLVKDQWDDIYKYYISQCVKPFIEDINDIENMLNTVQNVFFS